MKKMLLSLIFLSIILIGCQSDNNTVDYSETYDIDKIESTAEVKEGDFIYRLVSEKENYSENEPIRIYAELEYIGEEEKVEIFHAASPFYFPMIEITRNYEIHYNMDEPLISTVIIKGEPLREEYGGSGGYVSEDKKEYKEFIHQIAKLQFPEGLYIVNGFVDFFVKDKEDTERVIDYKIEPQIKFSVGD